MMFIEACECQEGSEVAEIDQLKSFGRVIFFICKLVTGVVK